MADRQSYSDSIAKINGHDDGVFVYIIQFGHADVVKVGIGKDPAGRLKTLQTGAYCRLYIRHVYGPMSREAAMAVEATSHDAMEARGLAGEWFGVSPDVAAQVVGGQLEYYMGLVESDCLEDFCSDTAKYFFNLRFSGGPIQ